MLALSVPFQKYGQIASDLGLSSGDLYRIGKDGRRGPLFNCNDIRKCKNKLSMSEILFKPRYFLSAGMSHICDPSEDVRIETDMALGDIHTSMDKDFLL